MSVPARTRSDRTPTAVGRTRARLDATRPELGSGEEQLQLATSGLRAHPEADLVPEITALEYEGLRKDIARRGVLHPLETTNAGVVLDGRARLRAATGLGLPTVPARIVEAADELEHMLLAALHRRHLTPSQRAALIVELENHVEQRAQGRARRTANLRRGPDVATLPHRDGRTRDRLASKAHTGARTIQDAFTVHDHDPELFQQVKNGRIAVGAAANRVRQRLRDQQLPQAGPMPAGPFQLIYADPPWQLGSSNGNLAPENHYKTRRSKRSRTSSRHPPRTRCCSSGRSLASSAKRST